MQESLHWWGSRSNMLQDKLYWPRRWIARKTKKNIWQKNPPQNNCQEWDRPAWKSWCCQAHQLHIHDKRTSGTILQADVRTWRHWECQRPTTSEGKGMDVKDVAWPLRYIESLLCKFYVMLSLWPYQLSDMNNPEKKKIDVQSFIEGPQLYIFGLSGKTMNNKY